MKYQLVLQLPCVTSADYDLLIELEDAITGSLGDVGIVDGHDYGASEMNIFIHTDDPRLAFEKARTLIAGRVGVDSLAAGYRDFNEDDYTVLYPDGLKEFLVK